MSPTTKPVHPPPDRVAAFFDEIAGGEHSALLGTASGTVSFELEGRSGVEHWSVTMDRGELSVSRRKLRADATARLDRKLFEALTQGKANLTAATLRGIIHLDGEIGLLYAIDRLFPGPSASRQSFLERTEELER